MGKDLFWCRSCYTKIPCFSFRRRASWPTFSCPHSWRLKTVNSLLSHIDPKMPPASCFLLVPSWYMSDLTSVLDGAWPRPWGAHQQLPLLCWENTQAKQRAPVALPLTAVGPKGEVKTLFAPFLISAGRSKHLQSVKSVSSETGAHVSPRLTADRVQPLTIPSHHCQSGPGNQPTGNCLPVCCLC